jgi:hypothetical protein
LSDISLVRRLLDQAELTSVRTARRQAKSWAEIATNLGITRQSAWERWREFDEPTEARGGPDPGERVRDEIVEAAVRETAARGRRGQVKVPGVVGLTVAEAREVLRGAGLIPASHIPGAAPDFDLPPDGTVTDQVPEAGARRRAGSTITLWIERGGGSAGVREPRRPNPSPRAASAERTESPERS